MGNQRCLSKLYVRLLSSEYSEITGSFELNDNDGGNSRFGATFLANLAAYENEQGIALGNGYASIGGRGGNFLRLGERANAPSDFGDWRRW